MIEVTYFFIAYMIKTPMEKNIVMASFKCKIFVHYC